MMGPGDLVSEKVSQKMVRMEGKLGENNQKHGYCLAWPLHGLTGEATRLNRESSRMRIQSSDMSPTICLSLEKSHFPAPQFPIHKTGIYYIICRIVANKMCV